jgi:hypothetical protein
VVRAASAFLCASKVTSHSLFFSSATAAYLNRPALLALTKWGLIDVPSCLFLALRGL